MNRKYYALVELYDIDDECTDIIVLITDYAKAENMDRFVDLWVRFTCYDKIGAYTSESLSEEEYNQLLVKDVTEIVFIDSSDIDGNMSVINMIDAGWDDE